MDRLGGGGISFIKRVSVEGFLFLPPFPPPHPWLPLLQRPIAEPVRRGDLGGGEQKTFALPGGFGAGAPRPPLVLEGMGFCSSQLPLEPTGPGHRGAS